MKKLLLGLLGGLSLGMLFAPKKGDELRQDLAKSDNKWQTVADNFSALAKNASAEVQAYLQTKEAKELLSKGKTMATELMGKAKDLSDDAKDELQTLLKNAETKGEKLVSDGKNAAKKAVESLKS